ncbi:hypothetical protein PR048_015619 [Dryococelus australis]|uniref:Reverse transcriptase RNase H-like domain-containing protein n=1 Tax=Dryococelus australis TaxID=614101 RepID=A0ABQ9HHR7_9NEOP|nr:hypothetical protein PR048_015619 [Dryococelus australis]
MGAALTQQINGSEHPIYYISRQLNKAERNYSTTERESLCVVFALKKCVVIICTNTILLVVTNERTDVAFCEMVSGPLGVRFEIIRKANTYADTLSRNTVHLVTPPYGAVCDRELLRQEQEKDQRISTVKEEV